MSAFNTTETADAADTGVVAKLSTLDRFLPVWILAAMAVGLLAGRLIPGLGQALATTSTGGSGDSRRSSSPPPPAER